LGKTSKPTKILIDISLRDWDEIKALQAQGHEIHWDRLSDYDIVLSPNCWNMDDSLRPYLLSHALPAARKRAGKKRDV
jgi:hypothetical protein